MISAAECLEQLGVVDSLELVAPHWESSQAEFPEDGLFFLRREVWMQNRALCGFGSEYDQRFQRVADEIEKSEAFRHLVWHMYWRVFRSPVPAQLANSWPEIAMLGDDAGLPGLLVALSWAPLLLEYHRQLGLPEEATLETLRQVQVFCEINYRRAFGGRPGIFPGQLSWLKSYLKNPYLRIGRFEYCLQPASDSLLMYRHRSSGQVIALCEAGMQFTAAGFRLGSPEEYEQEPDSWVSTLEFPAGAVCGNPILPQGYALRKTLTLPLNQWEQVFSRGDDCLRMHIPAGGRMTPECCGESLKRARDFFRKYFPQRNIRAVTCASWIFNPDLEEIMPKGANLTAFQRELYLYPVASGPWDGLWFIFLKTGKPDATFPCETDLQRRILAFIESGRRWRCGGMVILLEDIEHFGTQFYRNNFPEI